MPTEPAFPKPVPLQKHHELTAFDCGAAALNEYLQNYALQNHKNRSARAYVTMRDNRVVGYFTLAAGSVGREEVPARVAKGLGKYPVPIILLARLAVDGAEQGKGLGASLVKDALLRALQAADLVGCRAVVVHAKDQAAQAFYRKFDFESSPIDELHLYLLIKDIQANLAGSSPTA